MHKVFRLPQTWLLLLGVGLGFFLFINWLGTRSLVLIVGGAIALAIIGVWLLQVKDFHEKARTGEKLLEKDNLLNREVFRSLLPTPELGSSPETDSTWQMARHWAESSQIFSMKIAAQEPSLIPDLLEALHTVSALSREIAETLQAIDRLQTSNYRELARQRLEASCDRLKSSYEQLQSLCDRAILLEIPASEVDLPHQLEFLIEANQSTLELHKNFPSQTERIIA